MTLQQAEELRNHWLLESRYECRPEAIKKDHLLAEHKLAYYERLCLKLEREEREFYYDDNRD
jgi:hypothetical protein